RRRAGARGLGRLYPRSTADRDRRQLCRVFRCRTGGGPERAVPGRRQAKVGIVKEELPLGAPVDPTPAPRPGDVGLQGRFGCVEKLNAQQHGRDLWHAVQGHDYIWTYMSAYGPFETETAFMQWLRSREMLDDPLSYAIVDAAGRAVGIATLMEIVPAMRRIEVGH